MQGLPLEILSTIFISLLPTPTYRDRCSSVEYLQREVRTTLPLVCRYWNQVAVGTPDFWTYIRLSLKSTPDAMMKKLSLSGSCPLDVRICLDQTDSKPPTTQFRIAYNILVQSVNRWRSFVFDGLALCPEDVFPYIPAVLPNVVEAGYHVRLDDGDEGAAIPEGEDDQLENPRHKSWPIAPELRRFATTAAGQFHFVGCPLVEEYSVKDYHYTWGDPNMTGRSWQERWRRYVLHLRTTCPGMELLEVGLTANNRVDTTIPEPSQWIPREKWAILPKLRQLRIDNVGPFTLMSLLTHIDAPELREVQIGFVHEDFPLDVPITLSIPSSCRLRFENSPIHSTTLFLSRITDLDQRDVVIEMASAFQLQKRRQEGHLSYRLLDDKDEQTLKEASEFKWVEEHVRTLDLVLREEFESVPGVKERLQSKSSK